MEIVKDVRRTQFPLEITCTNCWGVLSIDKEDIFVKDGTLGVGCPICDRATFGFMRSIDAATIHEILDKNDVFASFFKKFKSACLED